VLPIPKKLVYFVLLVFLLSGQAIAAQNGLPVELERIAPEAAGLLNGNAEEGYGLAQGASTLLNYALSDLKEYLFAGIRSIAMILMGIILLGVVESSRVYIRGTGSAKVGCMMSASTTSSKPMA